MARKANEALARAGEVKTEGQPHERAKRPPFIPLNVLKTENGVGTVQVYFTEEN